MSRFFTETSKFTAWIAEHSPDWDAQYAALQQTLTGDPESGKVMKGCGGLRKIRVPDPQRGKGKRGGTRVIYLHVPEADCICMVYAYGKDEMDDLTPDDRKAFARAAESAKARILAAIRPAAAEDVE